MHTAVYRCAPWIILLGSFVILAVSYSSLPSDVVITREIFGTAATSAPRSLFTVFRVPLIELVCALAISLMMSKGVKDEVDADYNAMWRVLLFTVAFKSLFQTFETISTENANVFFYATLAIVIFGVILAFFPGYKFFSAVNRPHIELSNKKKILLASMLIIYVASPSFPLIFGDEK